MPHQETPSHCIPLSPDAPLVWTWTVPLCPWSPYQQDPRLLHGNSRTVPFTSHTECSLAGTHSGRDIQSTLWKPQHRDIPWPHPPGLQSGSLNHQALSLPRECSYTRPHPQDWERQPFPKATETNTENQIKWGVREICLKQKKSENFRKRTTWNRVKHLPNTEFKVMAIQILSRHWRREDEFSENLSKQI